MKAFFIFFFFLCPNVVFSSVSPGTTSKKIQVDHFVKKDVCRVCHDPSGSSKLRMLTGESLTSSQVPILCGQCHGIVKRDWDHAIHGKKVGSWTASGERLSCTKCHDPHSPQFPKMKAVPPPKQSKFGIKKGASDGQH